MPLITLETDRIVGDDSVVVVNGYVYFGIYGQDPFLLANRISIFADEALTVPLDNPLRTDEFGRLASQPYSAVDFSYAVYLSDNATRVEGPVNRRLAAKANEVLASNVFGVCKTVADMKSASGPLMTNGQRLTSTLIAAAANTGALIRTAMNNTTSRLGAADYEIKTLAQHRTDISNGSWVPDGYADHYLFSGTTYVAVLVKSGVVNVLTCGVLNNGTDTYAALQASWWYAQSIGADVFMPKGRYLCNTTLTWPIQTNIYGVGGKIGSQTDPQTAIVTTTLGSGVYQVESQQTVNTGYQNATFSDIALVCEGAATDVARGIRTRGKGSRILRNALINNNYGVANGAVENWVMDNYFNSNNICIEDSGGECHIINNHGYPETVAIVLRGSACLVVGNKFFGDGSNGEYGIEIWGSANQVVANVFDAFLEAAYYLRGNVTGLNCSHNYIVGNSAGTGVHGTSAIGAHVYMSATSSNVTHNEIYVSGYTNRADRTPTYFYRLSAVGAFAIDNNFLSGSCRVSDFPSAANIVSKIGAGVGAWNRVEIAGYKTRREWYEVVSNASVVNHGLDVAPNHISMTPSTADVYCAGYSAVSSTTFTFVGRDNTGTALSSVGINFRASRDYA